MRTFVLIAFVLIASIFLVSVDASSSPSPSPTVSSSPTSTVSPSPSGSPASSPTTCSGSAKVEFTATRQKSFGEEDNPSKIQENLKSAGDEIYNSKDFKDFLACTNPPTYSCPIGCVTNFEFYPEVSVNPPNAETPTQSGSTYSETGTFSVFLGINGISAFSGKIVEILKDLAKTISDKHKCPDGYSRQVTITVDSYVLEPVTIPLTGILIGYNAKVKYTVTVTCVKTDTNPTYAILNLKVTGYKTCAAK